MCAALSKLSPIKTTCIEYVHPWTDNCTVATAGLIFQAAKESARIYSAVYALSLLMRFRRPTLSDLKRTILGILQSSAFLTTSAFTYCLFLCILRKWMGSFNFFTVSYIPAFLSSMCAILIERPSRRTLLCLYVSNVATETLFNMACSRGLMRPISNGQVLIFGVSISAMLYLFKKGLHKRATIKGTKRPTLTHTSRDSIFDIIRFVVGAQEEKQIGHALLQHRGSRRSGMIIPPAIHVEDVSDIRDSRDSRPMSRASVASDTSGTSSASRISQSSRVYSIIMEAVRAYMKIVNYIKYQSGKHKTCPHQRCSCLYYVLKGGMKLFSIGVGLQATLNCLIHMKTILRQPKIQLKKIFLSKNILKLGLFLGGFSSLFRLGSCLFRHTTGKDDPLFAIPSGLLASLAFCWYPDTTVALYVMWKALQISYNIGSDAGYLPKVPFFSFFLYCASTATLFHAATLEPMNLRSSYWKFLHSLSGGRVAGMDRLPLDAYGLNSSEQLTKVLLSTKTKREISFIL